jgi:hypothetical protein
MRAALRDVLEPKAAAPAPTPSRVLIATPVYERADAGFVAAQHAACLFALAKNDIGARVEGTERAGLGWVGTDIVRSRSRFVADFLAAPEYSHLLFWDADVVGEPAQIAACISGMLRARRAIVGVPYPKKALHLGDVLERGTTSAALRYNYQASVAGRIDDQGCLRVDRVAGGFTLIARSCLEQMVDHYRHSPELVYDDEFDGTIPKRETVALFQLILRDRVLLSEDYSFCTRWTDLGGEIHLYLGPGSPLDHVGGYRFRGDLQGILAPKG